MQCGWKWTFSLFPRVLRARLFPAPAGMHRPSSWWAAACPAVPRARGDAPLYDGGGLHLLVCSPRPRGCTCGGLGVLRGAGLFPAPAGMHRLREASARPSIPVPRARGDAPLTGSEREAINPCSPRPRGCTRLLRTVAGRARLFPAPAGMHPTTSDSRRTSASVPRARGDAPRVQEFRLKALDCSPRPRGCTAEDLKQAFLLALFPAPAGMHRR